MTLRPLIELVVVDLNERRIAHGCFTQIECTTLLLLLGLKSAHVVLLRNRFKLRIAHYVIYREC